MNQQINNSERIRHYWLYTLRLQDNKYYVGKTSRKDPQKRINEHMRGFYSAQWTKKFKPIETMEIIDIGDVTDERADKLELQKTLQYMKKYGFQNVRGGKLNYSGKYVKIGNRFWRGEQFEILLAISFIIFVMIFLYFESN